MLGFHSNKPTDLGLIPATRRLLKNPPAQDLYVEPLQTPAHKTDRTLHKKTYKVGRTGLIRQVMTTDVWLSLREVYDLVSPLDLEICLNDVAHYLHRLVDRDELVTKPLKAGTKKPLLYRKADAKVSE